MQQKIFHNKEKNYIQTYWLSLATNMFILFGGACLNTQLIQALYSHHTISNTLIEISSGALFGILYVYFEAGLYSTQMKARVKPTSAIILMVIILLGLSEEILFRGYVNEIAMNIGGKKMLLLILFGTVAFGLSHLFTSWLQFFSKLIFSCCMTLFFILSGSLVMPMTAHAFFNFWVIKKYPLKLSSP